MREKIMRIIQGYFTTPSELFVRMSLIYAWAILCKEYLEPNLSIFEMHWLEMKVFL